MVKLLTIPVYHQQIHHEANEEAYKSTCQYLKFTNGNPTPHATGVFIKIENCHFLITAAHVVEDLENEIFLEYEKDKVVKLGGEWTICPISQGSERVKDQIDVAFLKLDDESIDLVKGRYVFLPDNEIQINHQISEFPLYSAIGFPATRNKFDKYKKELKRNPFILITQPASNEIYNQLECKSSHNIIVHYDKQNIFDYSKNQRFNGPDAYGMSGGGLWYVPQQYLKSEGKIEKRLVGILIEWPVKNRKYWIVAKIDIYTEIIRKKYRLQIEQSTQVKIDL
jgi:hypothetical protein